MSDLHAVKWHDISDVERFLAQVKLLTDLGNRHIDGHEWGYTHTEANFYTTGINGTHTDAFTLSLADIGASESNGSEDTQNNMFNSLLRRVSQRVYELAASLPPPRSLVITTTPSDATFRMNGGRKRPTNRA